MCAWNYDVSSQQQRYYTTSICIPNKGWVSQKFASALMNMIKPGSFAVSWEAGHQIDTSRNLQVTKAIQRKSLYVLFMDSDVIPESDSLTRLMGLELPMISAVYFSRSPPYHMQARVNQVPLSHEHAGKPEARQVTEVGMGFCLVDIRVFHRVGANLPWRCMKDHTQEAGRAVAKFTYPEAQNTNFACPYCKNPLIAPFFRTTIPYDDEDPLAEDFYFCHQVIATGLPIFVQLDVVVAHELSSMVVAKEGLVNDSKAVGF